MNIVVILTVIGLVLLIAIAGVIAGRSHRRTQEQARLMKKSLGIYVADESTNDGGFGGFDGADGDGGGGD